MSELLLIYKVNNEEKEFLLNDTNKDQWQFIDELSLVENSEFQIRDPENQIEHHLNLYDLRGEIYIFSILSCLCFEYASLDYNFFLVYNKKSKVFTYVQNNKKVSEVKDEFNNINLPDESLFTGLFRKRPVYYLDSLDNKTFDDLGDLPLLAYKSVETCSDNDLDGDGDNDMDKAYNISTCSLVPITKES